MESATVLTLPARLPISAEEFRADHERLTKLSAAWRRAMLARNGLKLIKERNKRSLETAEAEYAKAADEVAQLMTGGGLS